MHAGILNPFPTAVLQAGANVACRKRAMPGIAAELHGRGRKQDRHLVRIAPGACQQRDGWWVL